MEFGTGHVIHNAEQFWPELDVILEVNTSGPLVELDSALKSYIALAAAHHHQYLGDSDALDACVLRLLQSRLFEDHSQRMTDLVVAMVCEPSSSLPVLLICFSLILRYGRAQEHVFRSLRRVRLPPPPATGDVAPSAGLPGIIPVLIPIGSRAGFALERFAVGHSAAAVQPQTQVRAPKLPAEQLEKETQTAADLEAERRLGPVLAALLYELCRVKKLEPEILDLFTEEMINTLFELVELTRDLEDETFNYNLIKLIIALNEQFMVAGLAAHCSELQPTSPQSPAGAVTAKPKHKRGPSASSNPDSNLVLKAMKQRLDESKTFGENLIFILNRSSHDTPEGLCVSLLILKILYLLFTTPGTHEYFYTNDLCVLVDVFIRELNNLPEESEGLRHTFLRVLHPLLTQTQLRTYPYKRKEIRHVLLSHIQYGHLRDINPTTRRLVDRNLKGEWCCELEEQAQGNSLDVEVSPNGLACRALRNLSMDSMASEGSSTGAVGSSPAGSVTDVARAASTAAGAPSPAAVAGKAAELRDAVRAVRQEPAAATTGEGMRGSILAVTEAAQSSLPKFHVQAATPLVPSSPSAAPAQSAAPDPLPSLSLLPLRPAPFKYSSLPSTPSASYTDVHRVGFPPAPPTPRSLGGSPVPLEPQQAIQPQTTGPPVHRRPAPAPPLTKRNGEPVSRTSSPMAGPAPASASAPHASVESRAAPPVRAERRAPPGSRDGAQRNGGRAERRPPPCPPVSRRKPPQPPSLAHPKPVRGGQQRQGSEGSGDGWHDPHDPHDPFGDREGVAVS